MLKWGLQKYFVTTNCLVLSTKRLVAATKFLVAEKKKKKVLNFVAVAKSFFPCTLIGLLRLFPPCTLLTSIFY